MPERVGPETVIESDTVTRTKAPAEAAQIAAGEHANPHGYLGRHDGLVRAWRPDAESATIVLPSGKHVGMKRVHDAGVFEGKLPKGEDGAGYLVEAAYAGDVSFTTDDPYHFWPTLGDVDLHLIGEGRHEHLWEALGAHPRVHEGATGTAFAVWAPSARSVRVVGDFNSWDGRLHPMRSLGASGVWEIFLPGVGAGACYKFEILTPRDRSR